MINIDRYAYLNKIKSSPIEKFVFFLCFLIACTISDSLVVYITVLIIMSYATVYKAGIPTGFYLKILLLPLSFALLAILPLAFIRVKAGETVLFAINIFGYSIGLTYESILMAGKVLLKSMGAISCLYFLSLTTSIIQIVSVLRKIKIPIIIVELMSLIYRFIFVLIETADKIYVSQDSRLGYSSVKAGYFSLGKLITSLFVQSMNRSKALYTSLEARGYSGELKVLESEYRASHFKIILVIVASVALAMISLIPGVL